MKIVSIIFLQLLASCWLTINAQENQKNEIIKAIIAQAEQNSQLEPLAHELLDVIGPRLTGSPQMLKASDWVIDKYKSWGVHAYRENWGEWLGWERGVVHIDMLSPRVKSLEGMQLSWSPGTDGKTAKGQVIILPQLSDTVAFKKWLPQVKGKFVMLSALEPTGRPDSNWEEFALPESFEKMQAERNRAHNEWNRRIKATGHTLQTLSAYLEQAGAIGIITSNWSKGLGTHRIFAANTHKVPSVAVGMEDYGLLYRLASSGHTPEIALRVDAKTTGAVPVFNTIAELKGKELPDEYVVLSAHLDSWEGGSGATDNGTGTLIMMEALRILKEIYPNPKRTILVGHWGCEEHGLNGSKAFLADHPERIPKIQAVFNQDNGTGRVTTINGQGFLDAYEYLGRWLAHVPNKITQYITTNFPGTPSRGASDHASFLAHGIPAFYLSSLNWAYGEYTWHTNRDTYDKIVFDEVRSNVILTAILTYMACEDNAVSRQKATLINPGNGKLLSWPEPREINRKGRLDN